MTEVIHMATRKPLEEAIAEEAERELAEMNEQDAAVQAYQDDALAMLDRVRALVAMGRLKGLIVVGRDSATDLFMTEVRLRCPGIEREDMFAYMGVLETLKIEISEAACMAPVITSAGEILDPYDRQDEEEFDE